MGDKSDTVVEAFYILAKLCEALDEAPLNKHNDCWECVIDKSWKIAVNGHQEPKKCSLTDIPIDPFHCYVEYNGWPVGILNPYGGTIVASKRANENTFIEAVRERIRQLGNSET